MPFPENHTKLLFELYRLSPLLTKKKIISTDVYNLRKIYLEAEKKIITSRAF